jgi:PAS domain S-box-containing protein
MVIPDIQADPSYHAPPEWHGALAGVPLKMGDRVVGVMNVAFSEPRVFQEKELRVLRLLGDQAAIAIENARLYEQAQQELTERKQAEEVLRWARDELELRVRERTAELAQKAQDLARSNTLIAALNQVVTNIAVTPDPAEVMRTLGQELTRLNMGCLVAELDADKQALVISYVSLAPELLAAAEEMTGVVVLGWSIPLEAWAGAREAILSRQPVFAGDLSTIATGLLPFLPQAVIERSLRLVGIMAHTPGVYLPLMLEERFSGLLAVWGTELREDDLPTLRIFTNQVAVTIENARLYTSEHEKTTALAQTSQQLQQELAERLRIETALQQSELKYRTLVEQIPAVAYMAALNPAGNTRYISPQIEALLNFSEADWLANPTLWSQQLHPDDRERVFAVMAESRKTGRSFCAEYRLFTRDGRVVWVRDDAKVIPDSTGEPAFLHGVLFDISAHKQAEAQIKASLQEKEILLQEIHHRVKNNLQIIASLLNLQSGYTEDPQTQEAFRESQNRIRSMALIHEKLYRSENLARIDLGDYVHELAAFLFRSQGARHRGIIPNIQAERIFLDIDTAVPCGLILNELVSNTLKHAFPNGRPGKVWIEFRADEPDQLILMVADNGVGLPPGLDFRQTDSLGLQLVNTLVDQLGGIITLQSHHGARFKITFPCPPTTRTEP